MLLSLRAAIRRDSDEHSEAEVGRSDVAWLGHKRLCSIPLVFPLDHSAAML